MVLTLFCCIMQVQPFPSCSTAHPTICTWPSSLTLVYPPLASTWSTQVWGETACLTACHFVFCQFVSICPSATSFQLLHRGIRNKRDSWSGLAQLERVWRTEWVGKIVSLLIFSLCICFFGILACYSPVVFFLNPQTWSFKLRDPHPFFQLGIHLVNFRQRSWPQRSDWFTKSSHSKTV